MQFKWKTQIQKVEQPSIEHDDDEVGNWLRHSGAKQLLSVWAAYLEYDPQPFYSVK